MEIGMIFWVWLIASAMVRETPFSVGTKKSIKLRLSFAFADFRNIAQSVNKG